MENLKQTETKTETAPVEKPVQKPKKKECTAGQSTNTKFASISLFVICVIFIAMGIFFLASMKAYLGGVLLILFGVAFAVIDIVLNKSNLFKSNKSNTEENK